MNEKLYKKTTKQHTSRLSGPAVALSAMAMAVSGALAPTAFAQEPGLVLEEVLVTARKRVESIQEIPISVTSISAELQEATIRRLDDIQSFTPNLYIRNNSGIPGGAAISIRGVSYQETDKTLDPSIGVIMDGLYLGTSSGALLQNFDIQRIEVLRGPQGTLHGKNTTGGVLNIVRGDVTMDWGGDFSVALGTEGREDYKGVLNIPLIKDSWGLKLFGASINSDGHIENSNTGDDVWGDDKQTYGFATKWQATDNFDLKFHYEKFKDKTDTGAYANVNQPGDDLACTLEGALFPVSCEASDTGSDKDTVSTNDDNSNDSEYDTYILTMNWDFGPGLLTSITGLRDMEEAYRIEFDGSPANFLSFDYFNDWEQFSQELRLAFSGESFELVTGLYYWNAEYEQRWNVYELNYALQLIGVPSGEPEPLTPNSINWNGQNQETESYAVFAEGDWHINDKWTVTAGLRYTYEEKDFKGAAGAFYEAGEPVPEGDLEFVDFDDDWSEPTGKIGFQYNANDDIMLFGSFSTGFKSGGFFGRQRDFAVDPSYEPEYVNVYELGMKSTWMDGRMIFNPTIFYNDYEDKQEEVLIPIDLSNVSTAVRNAADVTIAGAELELIFQATENWNLRASYGYLDAEFKDFIADLNGDGQVTDNSGLRPRNTPENTIGLNSTFTANIGPGEFVNFISYRWRDEVEVIVDNDPLGSLDSIQNLDITFSYLWGEDGRYRLTAFGRNITDERERIVVRIPPLTTWGSWNQGENYGVEFAIRF